MEFLRYARSDWRDKANRLRSTGRPTRELMNILSGISGVGVLLAAVGMGLGVPLGLLLGSLGVPRHLAFAVGIAVLSAPGAGYGLWASLGAARTRLWLLRHGRDPRRRIGRRSIEFLLGWKRYAAVIGVCWIAVVAPLLLAANG